MFRWVVENSRFHKRSLASPQSREKLRVTPKQYSLTRVADQKLPSSGAPEIVTRRLFSTFKEPFPRAESDFHRKSKTVSRISIEMAREKFIIQYCSCDRNKSMKQN
ncbi:hypothetical protein Zmor_024883 [Zophobas morio]|uniref:Uncharacterized protein n=1 Tax=Zophobas morio TaxID=2755281 RepID=A0AA38M343_9CUCU|nr:hypothetical protein Zmor_024883 [Zophobas morio]